MDRGARRGDVGFVSRRDRDYVDYSQLVDTLESIIIRATISQEAGWYDGQVYVKTPEMLAKDRLDGTYVRSGCGKV